MPRSACVIPLLVFLLAGPARAAPLAAELLTPDLERRAVGVLSVAGGRLRAVDGDRNATDSSLRGVVRLSFGGVEGDPDAPPAGPLPDAGRRPLAGHLILTDGQVLAGRPAAEAGGGESLAWAHPRLGRVVVPLGRVASVSLGPEAEGAAPGRPRPPSADRLRLANGDALVGFAVSTDAAGVAFEPEGGAAATVPWAAVAGLRLANPAAGPPAGDLVELADGSRFAASARFDGAVWTLADPLPGLSPPVAALQDVEPAAVVALEPGASGLRRLGLGGVTVDEPEPAVAFGVPFPARSDGGVLRLHAPTRVVLSAPGVGVRRARVRLALDPVAAASPLAALEADLGGPPVRLDAARPSATLAAEGAGPLVLTLAASEHGPVLDRVVVESVELLVAAD
ncbi:serine/threonine-protein kinase [Phycisphaera mikurensis]|uniref:Uncharacterized protein n=1 Tax=Phycisphaera mikurensis (strain NBRC 102666 / KCTC 22515 / FYK2301M01) TaxID=1142394 RepID=I0IBR0_PHYMF|nr:hypothetical protein [Phycisphaera mikurensis]MBB6443394.1 hypothetical protein [Phycisphaera mikurensis]BAM02698.1 hypothetical protein PSMK_05390 [Phycisphaera mikurensis NBRC 102666]